MTRSLPSMLAAAMVLCGASLAGAGESVRFPPRNSPAARITLPDSHGTGVDTDALKGRTLVLLFADFGQDRLPRACADLHDALADPRLEPKAALPIAIVAQRPTPEQLKAAGGDGVVPELILLDDQRAAFGAYKIVVIPSVVIVSPERKVVYAMPTFAPRFRELLVDSVLRAAGTMTEAQFEAALATPAEQAAQPESEVRAARISNLAAQLVKRGLPEMAEERYREALSISPGYAPAQLGLAQLLLDAGKPDDAQAGFAAALAADPASLEARLGLARVNIARGGDKAREQLPELTALAADHPESARVLYTLGLLQQQLGQDGPAAASFRRAAELLLNRPEKP